MKYSGGVPSLPAMFESSLPLDTTCVVKNSSNHRLWAPSLQNRTAPAATTTRMSIQSILRDHGRAGPLVVERPATPAEPASPSRVRSADETWLTRGAQVPTLPAQPGGQASWREATRRRLGAIGGDAVTSSAEEEAGCCRRPPGT